MIASTQAPNDDSVSISTGSRSGGAGRPPPGLGGGFTCPKWGRGGRGGGGGSPPDLVSSVVTSTQQGGEDRRSSQEDVARTHGVLQRGSTDQRGAPEQPEQWRRSEQYAECEWREHQNLPPQQSPPGPNKSHLPPATAAAPKDADLCYEWSDNDSRTNQSTDGDHRGVHMSIQENSDANWTMCYVQNLPNRYGPATILNLLLMNDTVQGDPVFRKAMLAVMDKDIGDE